MSRSANAAFRASDVSGEGGTGPPERQDQGDLAVVADAAGDELVVQEQGALARRRRALERRAADADDGVSLREARDGIAHPHGARERVELVDPTPRARASRSMS